jgi:hypothetical protein
MGYGNNCDHCGHESIAAQLCVMCFNEMVEIIEEGEKDEKGNYPFTIDAYWSKKKCNNPNHRGNNNQA